MELYEKIEKLAKAHGPSGNEREIRDLISQLAKPYADEIKTDAMGNLIVRKYGNGPKVMFAAHMDSIGFIVTHVEENGFLRVGKVGGVDPQKVIYTPVQFQNGLHGTFVPEEKAGLGKLKLEECCLDIGAKDEAQARSAVQVGDTAVYAAPTYRVGSKVVSPYMDDRIACAVLLSVLERLEKSSNDLYFVFTVQEEVGLRGAKTAAWGVDPDYGVALDVTYVDDVPGSEHSGTAKLGGGAAVKVMDASVICHPYVVSQLESLAKAENILTQRDILRKGGTDAGPIHTNRIGVRTGGISIPCRYMHTPTEMIDLEDVECCIRLALAFAQSELERF